jgi:DNA-binding MarR family transcriptional regulator
LALWTVTGMNTPPNSLATVTERFLDYFQPTEFRFRWADATGLDSTLPRRANHLAARLNTLYFVGHTVKTSYAELRQVTRMSQKSLERALPELIAGGWVSTERSEGNIYITLRLNDRGLDLLLDERERRRQFAGRREINEQWATYVFDKAVSQIGANPESVRDKGKWRILYSKIRSIVSHMGFPESESRKLLDELTEALPQTIQDAPGLLLSRAAEHVRRRPHLRSR